MRKIFAIVRFSFEALHNWPDPTNDEVYLAYPHRHIFHVEVKVEQFHNERDIEYLELKRHLLNIFGTDSTKNIKDLGAKSCETIAHEILDQVSIVISSKEIGYKEDRDISVSVFEDNENGALVSITA